MSRLRAIQAQKIKHAEVTPADIEAAVNILKLKHNSDDFWKKAARRCNLQVVDEDDTTILSYAEVEANLSSMPHNRRSRSRSTSRPPGEADIPSEEETSAKEDESADDSSFEDEDGDEDEDEEVGIRFDTERLEAARDREEKEEAMEAYTESLDQQKSREEEATLWKMIGQVPTKKSNEEEEEEVLVRPRRLLNVYEEQLGWREHVNFRSEWEVMNGVVGEEEFKKNRNRVVKHRRSSRDRSTARDEGSRGGLSSEFVGDDEEGSLVGDEQGNGSGEEDAQSNRSVQLNQDSDQEEILGSVEEAEEAGSEGEERRVRKRYEDGDESMEMEVGRSEHLEDDEFTDVVGQRAAEEEEEEGNYEDEEDD